MKNQSIDRNSPEFRTIQGESRKLWAEGKYLEAARIWEDASLFEVAAEMYQEAGNAYDTGKWVKISDFRKSPECWFNSERIWTTLGNKEKADHAKASGKASLRQIELAEKREKPSYPSPREIFQRMDFMKSKNKVYEPKNFIEELENIGFELEKSGEEKYSEGFEIRGVFKGPSHAGIFDRTQTTWGKLEVKTNKILATAQAQSELSIELITWILPSLFGKSTREYSSYGTMCNYGEWIRPK